MRVFLAGATGVIGRRVVPLLRERGHSVTGFVRRDADADWLRSLGAKAVRGDVFDADGVRRAVALAAPDVVMHQLTDLKGGNRQANSEMRVTGTRNLVDAALAAGVRRVVAQSIAWAYAAGEVPAAEDVPLDLGSSGSPAADGAGGGCAGGGGAGGAGVGGAAVRAAVRAGDLVLAGRADGGYRGARGAGGGRGREQLRARGRRGGRGGGRAVLAGRVRQRVRRRARAGARVGARVLPGGGGGPVPAASGGERHGWARGASNELARKQLHWTPAWPSWREGFAAL